MYLFIVTLHIFLSVVLVLSIILQPGKNDIGSAFGGGGGSGMFGPRGPASVLSRLTTVVAVLFMVTSISLAWYSDRQTLSDADVTEEILRGDELGEPRRFGSDEDEDDEAPAPVEFDLVPSEEQEAEPEVPPSFED